MKIRLLLLMIASYSCTQAQTPAVFTSSDSAMQRAYEWAGGMVRHYQGNPADPVGPWYEAALPSRMAFCMRDVAHQTIGATIYGLAKENRNMIGAFARHISAKKDWCSYWEINKYGKPAPEDYRNDTAFWYNLNANFDILSACWRLYQWTGDTSYITDPVLVNFFEKTANEYIRQWTLQSDSLLTRPLHPNASSPFNQQDNFHVCRGLPSYVENVADLKMGVDLIATIYRGLLSYAAILKARGNAVKAAQLAQTAARYQQQIEEVWWNEQQARYYTWYNSNGKFGNGEGAVFLLWFDALKDSARSRATIAQLTAGTWNVETTSYLPVILFKQGYWQKASEYILQLTDPGTPRREYPEVSFAVLEAIVRGLMGIEPDAVAKRITTLYRAKSGSRASIKNLRVLHTTIAVNHAPQETVLRNTGKNAFLWKAAFAGEYHTIRINNIIMPARHEVDNNGNMISYVEVMAKGNKTLDAKIGK
ncbi:hypothetical protein FHW36_1011090 [Chitinophaga polysaccharea]|uniref:Trehalase n=1 Tax=Chitinophaga polysaccharea TaxID=1293035 RepID=A0A561Q468_9BACT|nr:hypothetical protein [Chitinophaga polysaccharea]TWF45163.1 hypothetical protein FHW36_1011090 [Chitinophaga polysaccharea]